MIKAVIFDMDGVLINSEPLWKKAEQKVFRTVGIELNDELCNNTTGLDNLSTVKFWHSYKPWKNKSVEEIAEAITNEIIVLLSENHIIKEGVEEIINWFGEKKIPVAVASSSEMKIIIAVLEKLKLKDKFAAIYSSEYEEYGKPHPGVYISTAKLLKTNPEKCLAFEDSFYGMLAAKSARMKVVAVLEEKDLESSKYGFADHKIVSFKNFKEEDFEFLNSML